MRVRDFIEQKQATVITVHPGDPLSLAIDLLIDHNIGGLPVLLKDGSVVGFVAERDVVRALHEHRNAFAQLRVQDVMQRAPLCEADDSLEHVMRRMTAQRRRHLVAVENGHVIGVISVGDIVKHRLDELEMETSVLRDYVAAGRASR